MRTTANAVRTVLAVLAVLVVSAGLVAPAAAQLVNPGFDSGPVGPVGNFGTVVGPPFQAGFWGAEDADILPGNPCFGARSNPNLLQLNIGGGSYSQAWQAVDVSTGPPTIVTLNAWFNTCAGDGKTVVGVAIRTFNGVNGWPSHTLYVAQTLTLDTNSQSWEKASLDCVSIPGDTKWIVAEVFMANATALNPSSVDDVELLFDPHCPVPTQQSTWGAVKALYR